MAIKVVPKNDIIRKQIKHPTAGPFRAVGSMDWPNDSFTARRIKDGDVTVVEEPPADQPEGTEASTQQTHPDAVQEAVASETPAETTRKRPR